MAQTLTNIRIALRTDDEKNWASSNPILKTGELAIVKTASNNIKIKVGDGIQKFNELQYLNDELVETGLLSADEVSATSLSVRCISQGYNTKSSPTSLATGILAEAEANFGVVHGIEAKIKKGDDYAFVFNGTNLPGIADRYTSHGEGTFNVNPVSGVNGFYIGNQTLSGILSSSCQPKGNYLSSNALNGYKTYDNTVTSLTAQSGFKTYADAKSSLSSDGYATQAQLDVKTSVSVDNQRADVNILHISQEDYSRLVANNEILSNFVYVVSGDYVNAYGQQVKNLAIPTDPNDAATKNYVDQEIANLSDEYQPKGNYLTSHQSLGNYYTKTQVNSISSYLSEQINSHESTPLAGKTYDLSQNGMFTKLVVDVGRALGATITNSPVDGLLAASIVDGDEMRFGN